MVMDGLLFLLFSFLLLVMGWLVEEKERKKAKEKILPWFLDGSFILFLQPSGTS